MATIKKREKAGLTCEYDIWHSWEPLLTVRQ